MGRPRKKPKKHLRAEPADAATIEAAYETFLECGEHYQKAADKLGVSRETLRGWIKRVRAKRGVTPGGQDGPGVPTAPPASLVETLNRMAGTPGLVAKMEQAAEYLITRLVSKVEKANATVTGQRLHVLLGDLQMLYGRPQLISREESSSTTANIDLSALTSDELLNLSGIMRKILPGTGIEYASGKPVILESEANSGREENAPDDEDATPVPLVTP